MTGTIQAPNGDAAPAIDVRFLRVDYGDFVAVDDLTLSVPSGEVFGLVGTERSRKNQHLPGADHPHGTDLRRSVPRRRRRV
jgi:hypothetical protein